MTGWTQIEAEKAFGRAARARRRAALRCRVLRRGACGLAVHDAPAASRAALGARDIALDEINGTLEPNRAHQFDDEFRPAPPTRTRWQSVWMAEHRGVPLPPISVVRVGDAYAIRDGHHRVSVAKARGAATISAVVAAA